MVPPGSSLPGLVIMVRVLASETVYSGGGVDLAALLMQPGTRAPVRAAVGERNHPVGGEDRPRPVDHDLAQATASRADPGDFWHQEWQSDVSNDHSDQERPKPPRPQPRFGA